MMIPRSCHHPIATPASLAPFSLPRAGPVKRCMQFKPPRFHFARAPRTMHWHPRVQHRGPRRRR
jgi:hypothetical protein